MKEDSYDRSKNNKDDSKLNPFQRLLKDSLKYDSNKSDSNYFMDIDCIHWNYPDKQIEIIEGNLVNKEEIISKANLNSILNKAYYGKAFRKKILLQWNLIKDLGKGKLFIIFWGKSNEIFRICEITDIDESKPEPIEYEAKNLKYNEFKNWLKEWNLKGKK